MKTSTQTNRSVRAYQISLETQLAILRHSAVQLAARLNPDCTLRITSGYYTKGRYCSGHVAVLSCCYYARDTEGYDLRELATEASSDGYQVTHETISAREYKVRGKDLTFRVQVCLTAQQNYDASEIATLRSLGKLQTQVQQAYTYNTLVCGA